MTTIKTPSPRLSTRKRPKGNKMVKNGSFTAKITTITGVHMETITKGNSLATRSPNGTSAKDVMNMEKQSPIGGQMTHVHTEMPD